jgi:hypothetical protein
MTLSRKKREDDRALALRLMLQDLGYDVFAHRSILIESGEFLSILNTTWEDLRNRGWIERPRNRGRLAYCLTPDGWIESLRASGVYDTKELHEKVGRLTAALKGEIDDDRSEPGFVHPIDLARKANLSEKFVYNAILSDLIARLHGEVGGSLSGPDICIPINIGHSIFSVKRPGTMAHVKENQECLKP